jgi:serine/threonine protein kinase
MIVGNLSIDDLELKEVIGNGASGYVYKAIHLPTSRVIALKSINSFDHNKRHQLMNDLRSLHKNKCPFLIEFCGALYEEGIVKIALEYMDMGSMKDIIKGARKLNKEWISSNKEACLIPESIMAKMI